MTDDTSNSATDPRPAFVLVRPQMGENIGAAARSMLNFELEHMRVTAPRDGWPNERAVALASGAGRILDHARICDTTQEAVADCTFVFATTARDRDLTKPVYTPEAAMIDARKRGASGQKVAVLFGPERTGLENDDIALANAIVSVPTNPAFASLNLAQCVLLMGYEWRRTAAMPVPMEMEMADTQWASHAEMEALIAHYEERLEEARFFWPEGKAAAMKVTLRNLWSRMPLTRADVQVFHGMMRQMVRWKERG
ncbi:tRNA/rRNA methyltransferase [Jannaschia faecimaris]|uniref:tRNA/rRNA methyltransferase n=1 Tax=Jannaschia faecimaris TaxID=1244108 RepID=A0A1H3NVM1_9RHOB|nr:RNA methyltransferase [Jannaschia faecimaris]SDY92888.1 tRNA/rRNA methyltransferase [Jannaschia faecimaris]